MIIIFNDVLLGVIEYLADNHGGANTIKIKVILENVVDTACEEPIAFFVLNVYNDNMHRNNILKQNDDFFVNNNFAIETDELTIHNFELRSLWDQIDNETKESMVIKVY